jgi:hypothetical protein
MPTFCRHNRLIQNCPICAREQHIDLRPIVSPGGRSTGQSRSADSSSAGSGSRARSAPRPGAPRPSAGLRVRRLERETDDGYRSELLPGLKSGAGAQRLAAELAFAATRLARLSSDPPGLYAEVADPAIETEERAWLAFEIAYLGPLDGPDPFAAVARARTSWSSGQSPSPDELELGPRSSHEPGRGTETFDAYRTWALRAGSQAAAFTGDAGWSPARRFGRAFERLSLPRFQRGAKFDLLVTLGCLGVYDLQAGSLVLGGNDGVTIAAKRLLGIGDPMLLDRRAAALADACGIPLGSLDAGFYNWERGVRAPLGIDPSVEPAPALLTATHRALGL